MSGRPTLFTLSTLLLVAWEHGLQGGIPAWARMQHARLVDLRREAYGIPSALECELP